MVFPQMVLHFDVGRKRSVEALEQALADNSDIFLVAQKDEDVEEPTMDDLYPTGTIAEVKQVLKLPNENVRVLVEGKERAELKELIITEQCLSGKIKRIEETIPETEIELAALMRTVKECFEEYVKSSGRVPQETVRSIMGIQEPRQMADVVAASVLARLEDKQQILSLDDVGKRLEVLCGILTREAELAGVEKQVQQRVRAQIEKNQKDYFLREQIRAIQTELGDTEEKETDALRERIESTPLNEEAYDKAKRELDRLSRMPAGTPEANVSQTYLEWILDLPWGKTTEDNLDLKRARRILDEDHDGLDKVKERIIEYLAVSRMRGDLKGPILCLVGPPGVGKTSIARSVSKALGRKFVQMSLGGVRDEAEIRGHRRTYIGAIPGRVIYGLKQAQTMNPVFLFDEIDKMSHDFHGDPASAMLEVLDSEQNHAFRDHYLELPFDLSKVLFLLTANNAEEIPAPLLDRMEIIEISGYTDEEKLAIARHHLLPKQIKGNGLSRKQVSATNTALRKVIDGYTREAGVRQLEREIASLMRKAACRILEGEEKVSISGDTVSQMLGNAKFHREKNGKKPEIGVAQGLAYTVVGGETLVIETSVMMGTGILELTGRLGDVMKESARAALSYIRAHSQELGLAQDFHKSQDIHIHIPEGAVPKDGPSAGVTLTTSMVSALTGTPVRQDIAMTGEITLRGRVLPVGGIKEKLLAAYRMGIDEIILPKDNVADLDELPKSVHEQMTFHLVDDVHDVLRIALCSEKAVSQPDEQ